MAPGRPGQGREGAQHARRGASAALCLVPRPHPRRGAGASVLLLQSGSPAHRTGALGQRSTWATLGMASKGLGLQGAVRAGGGWGSGGRGACAQTLPPPSALHVGRAPGAEFALKKGKLRLRKGVGPTQGHTKETRQNPRPVLAASSRVPPSAAPRPRCGVGGSLGPMWPQGPQGGDPLGTTPTRSHRGCGGAAP